MKKINNKGFTLIELLVVVAIIAILAGIVLVSLNSARERSEKASLQSTMASVMPVVSMCVNDGEALGAAVEGNPVCPDSDDIDETWPVLPDNLDGYSYALDNDTTPTMLVGSDATGAIIECTIATGSCVKAAPATP